MMSSHLALPRQGHMQELFHMFAYLKKHHNAEMVFDPSDPDLDESLFPKQDWAFLLMELKTWRKSFLLTCLSLWAQA